ncbi:receptor-type tyrosine-protein phosphatase T-like isoform X3 [Saccostrea cucullata]|uniref:receptor-type tyrosine-protein phosphatase T-like isoform X3 n=1 Tax=Saccostrea cuccullata TaxID=36930 RepID=UPI002ED1D957
MQTKYIIILMKTESKDIHSYTNETANLQEEAKTINKNQKISVADLWKTIEEMCEDNGSGFKAEYEKISKGELHSCDAGKRDENKTKNRYKSTFPYDHSRVKFRMTDMKSDYINANYIKDISGEQRYIATQGPKKKTVADFWTMIWQESIEIIVCLTNLKEEKKEKCAQYWPNCNDKVQSGNFTIRNLEEKTYSNYIKRHLKLQNTIGKEEKDVWMFHYTQWPDHGVPEAINLVVFHRHVQRVFDESVEKSKIAVHCSAGLGRTGTFIALDALYRHGLESGSVNVSEYVTQMRDDRMNMVQGEDQYKMIYTALYESFRGHLRPVTDKLFLSDHQTLNSKHQEDEIKKEQEADDFKTVSYLRITVGLSSVIRDKNNTKEQQSSNHSKYSTIKLKNLHRTMLHLILHQLLCQLRNIDVMCSLTMVNRFTTTLSFFSHSRNPMVLSVPSIHLRTSVKISCIL